MKPLEILSALPDWSKATPDQLLASPAWTLPCRLGDTPCGLRLDAPRPADTLDILVRLENEEHVLGLVDSPALPDLHAVWSARAEMPEPILLALVEKDCGPLLQLIENATRRQLKVIGLAGAPAEGSPMSARVFSDTGDILSFTLDPSPALTETLGQLRFIDASHPEVRAQTLRAEVAYASFALGAADLAALAPGDALLLPAIGTLAPKLIVDGRFLVSDGSVSAWQDDGLLRVNALEPPSVSLGDLLDAASGNAESLAPQPPAENTPLRLVGGDGATLATGRLGRVGSQPAFLVDALGQ